MKTSVWNRIKRPLELLIWVGVLGFVLFRLGPQVTAIFGIGAGDDEISVAAFRALDGSVFTREDLEGKVVLVNAWATWCPPCVIEMPGFQRVYDDYRDQGFLVLGVSRDQGDPAPVKAFLQKKGITYPVAMARDVDLGGITDVEILPTSFLIGRDGTIRHRVEGLYAGPALRLAVKRLLDEG
ncbi:MAG: TlpA family protein disulfide reductase [Longimicrobiales bacterium]|nr:TlpA family protein disulfide reductase [Longimicrobiales bacterium]